MKDPTNPPRTSSLALLIGSLIVAGGTGYWAGRVALTPPAEPLTRPSYVEYQVSMGEVGRTIEQAAWTQWDLVAVGGFNLAGTVTSVDISAGAEVGAGEVMLTVDLRPVVAAHGVVPMFRDIGEGTRGSDVAQLEQLLVEVGLVDTEPDEVFDESTADAVRGWQTSLGVNPDGVVRRSDLVFVNELPFRVSYDESVTLGGLLTGGSPVILAVPPTPVFWIPLSPEQSNLIPAEAAIRIEHGDGSWDAQVTEIIQPPGLGEMRVMLDGLGGEPVCGTACAEAVPLVGQTVFRTFVELVPQTAGPLVPVAALHTTPSGGVEVEMADGSRRPVMIVAAANGLAVISGLDVDEVVRIPISDASQG